MYAAPTGTPNAHGEHSLDPGLAPTPAGNPACRLENIVTVLVTVVTPTLNPGSRLERCIASVKRQTYARVEHLVVDGGSTDGTLERLEVSGVRWISEPDSGQASAINKGWRMAAGDLLGWLNADDELLPDAVEKVVDAFGSAPDVDWILGAVEIREESGGFIRRPADPAQPLAWAAQNMAAQPGSFVSRRAIHAVGYLDEALHYMMDLDLWVRLLDAGLRVALVPHVLAVFEVHPDSKSGSLSHSEFVIEEALVRLRSGRSGSGAVAVGRAAAIRALERNANDIGSMATEANAILRDPRLEPFSVEPVLVDAGVRAESLLMGIKKRRLELLRAGFGRYLWRHPEARARLGGAFARARSRLRYRVLHR